LHATLARKETVIVGVYILELVLIRKVIVAPRVVHCINACRNWLTTGPRSNNRPTGFIGGTADTEPREEERPGLASRASTARSKPKRRRRRLYRSRESMRSTTRHPRRH